MVMLVTATERKKERKETVDAVTDSTNIYKLKYKDDQCLPRDSSMSMINVYP